MTQKDEGNEQFFCSFCGKNQKEVKKLIAGPSVYICNECIKLCSEIIEDEEKERLSGKSGMKDFMTPKEIKAMLDRRKETDIATQAHTQNLELTIARALDTGA